MEKKHSAYRKLTWINLINKIKLNTIKLETEIFS